MAVEARRKCGYRKVGGLYLVSGALAAPCCKMPIILHVCPTCNAGVKPSRGWQWIDPRPWLEGECRSYPADAFGDVSSPLFCPAANPAALGERVGLLWIGEQFYATPASFTQEAAALGISRRVHTIPRGFKVGETWVFLAHRKVREVVDPDTGESTWLPGVFRLFKPERIEKLITVSQSQDAEEMARLEKQGITPVIVPDDDKDHQGSVYDDKAEEPELELTC